MQAIEAEQGLLRYALRQLAWKPFITKAPLQHIGDTWSHHLKRKAIMGPVWATQLKRINHRSQVKKAQVH